MPSSHGGDEANAPLGLNKVLTRSGLPFQARRATTSFLVKSCCLICFKVASRLKHLGRPAGDVGFVSGPHACFQGSNQSRAKSREARPKTPLRGFNRKKMVSQAAWGFSK